MARPISSGYGTRGGTAATLSAKTTFPAWRLSLSNGERLCNLRIRLRPLAGCSNGDSNDRTGTVHPDGGSVGRPRGVASGHKGSVHGTVGKRRRRRKL